MNEQLRVSETLRDLCKERGKRIKELETRDTSFQLGAALAKKEIAGLEARIARVKKCPQYINGMVISANPNPFVMVKDINKALK